MERTKQKLYEDEAYVLDIIPQRPGGRQSHVERNMQTAQMLGAEYFTLLEALVNQSLGLKPGMKTYIGRDVPRDLIRIVRRITYNDLTENAKYELEKIIDVIVHEREAKFVEFINTCSSLTPRLHALETIPGIGKKLMQKILEEREKQPFTSYEDIKNRVGIADIDKAIAKRVLIELSDPNNRHWLFVRIPSQGPIY
jgi:putative nucleotide binding protein